MRTFLSVPDRYRARARDLFEAEIPPGRWLRAVLSAVSLLLLASGVTIYLLDPYQRYHKKSLVGPFYKDEYRMIPHLLDTMDYDSLVAGTSMCLDFSLADFRDLLGWKKPLKIAARGCRPATFKLFADRAFSRRKIEHVLCVIDISILAKEPGSHYIPLEPFLYSRSLLHECAYLFNGDVLFGANLAMLRAHLDKDPLLNPDLMFCNDDGSGRVKFGAERVWKALRTQRKSETEWIGKLREFDSDLLLSRMINNFETHYLSVVKAHPETTFIFFYPPYSYLFWGFVEHENATDLLLNVKAIITKELLAQPNVAVYDFQAEDAIVTDLSNYRDLSHFKQGINHLIVTRIATGMNKCEPNTVSDNAVKIRALSRRAIQDLQGVID